MDNRIITSLQRSLVGLDFRIWDRNPTHNLDWAEGPQPEQDSQHSGESERQLCGDLGVEQPETGCQTILT